MGVTVSHVKVVQCLHDISLKSMNYKLN